MAQGKNSFVLYTDNKELWEEITDEQAGKLIKHIFRYVNDEDPKAPDDLTKLLFIPIKYQLKRDLKKYEAMIEKRSKAGKASAKARQENAADVNTCSANPTSVKSDEQRATSSTESDSDSDSDSEINSINTIYNKKEFLEDWNLLRTQYLKKPSFLNSLTPDDLSNLKELSEQYSRANFKEALIGLFKQKKLPNGNTTMQSNPSHFLKFFNSYLTAYHDKNNSLYGKEKVEL